MAGSADDLYNAGLAKHRTGELRAAEALYGQALALAPDHLPAAHNLAVALQGLGRLEAALAMFERAIALAPGQAGPLFARGRLLLAMNRLAEAEAAFREVIALDPAMDLAKRNLGHALIAQGRFAEGFALYEFRPERLNSNANRLPFPEWRGEPLAGKRLYVFGEQGLGDQIMMARFLPRLQALGAQTTYGCLPPLHRLLRQVSPVTFASRVEEVPAHDYWVASMSLPGRLGMTPQTLPPAPYLPVPDEVRALWPRPTGDRLRVGFVWRGEPRNPNDANRSLASPEPFLALADHRIEMIDLQVPRGDFADMAAIVETLDLVMAVDTAMVHLAGALGRPCWALIPALGADWRWPPGEAQTPWYGSVRTFRQAEPGDWAPVFARLRAALEALMRET